MLVRSGVLFGFVVLVSGCAAPRGQQLCDAIARRDVGGRATAAGRPGDQRDEVARHLRARGRRLRRRQAGDKVLTGIGVELVSAGLPADASWIAPGRAEPVWAIEAAAGNGNVELVRALLAVGLDMKSPEATKRWCRRPAPDICESSSCSSRRAPTSRRRPAARRRSIAPAPRGGTTWRSSSRQPPRRAQRACSGAASEPG